MWGSPASPFFGARYPFWPSGQGSTSSCVKLAAEHLNRSEEGHAEVLAEVEALRADLQLMRTQVGSAIGVDLVQP